MRRLSPSRRSSERSTWQSSWWRSCTASGAEQHRWLHSGGDFCHVWAFKTHGNVQKGTDTSSHKSQSVVHCRVKKYLITNNFIFQNWNQLVLLFRWKQVIPPKELHPAQKQTVLVVQLWSQQEKNLLLLSSALSDSPLLLSAQQHRERLKFALKKSPCHWTSWMRINAI